MPEPCAQPRRAAGDEHLQLLTLFCVRTTQTLTRNALSESGLTPQQEQVQSPSGVAA